MREAAALAAVGLFCDNYRSTHLVQPATLISVENIETNCPQKQHTRAFLDSVASNACRSDRTTTMVVTIIAGTATTNLNVAGMYCANAFESLVAT